MLEIVAGSSSIRHTVQVTATAEQFARFEAGVLQLGQGQQTLNAQVVLAPDTELMRLNAIHLQRLEACQSDAAALRVETTAPIRPAKQSRP